MKPTSGAWDLVRCQGKNCTALWLEPMPDEAPPGVPPRGFAKIAFGLIARVQHAYLHMRYGYADPQARPGFGWVMAVAAHLSSRKQAEWDVSVMHLPTHASGRLLNVGCGSGKSIASIRDRGWEVSGCDFNEKAVARSRLLDVGIGGIEAQRYEPERFDVVTLSRVIEHVPDPRQTLREYWRILKNSGELVITTPNTALLAHRIFKGKWMHLDTPRHLHLIAGAPLLVLVRECGFAQARAFTTVWGADLQYYFSHMIARSGRNSMVVPPARRMILPSLFAFLESLALRFLPAAEEELVVIATK